MCIGAVETQVVSGLVFVVLLFTAMHVITGQTGSVTHCPVSTAAAGLATGEL